jgi:hypothetical protein
MERYLRPRVQLTLAVLTIAISTLALAQTAQTPTQPTVSPGVPRLVKFSGLLKDASGSLLANTVGITFAVYGEQTGGVPLWQETQNVQFSQGRYTVFLGESKGSGIPAELFASGQPRWLGVKPLLPGEEEQPRVLLASVPYALKAVDADTLGGLPASAFIQANGSNSNSVVLAPGTATGSSKHRVLPPLSTVTTPGGTVGTIAEFDTSTDIKSSPIVDSGGIIGVKNFENIRFADQFPGSDCGAKITAADGNIGSGVPGEIWVNQKCGLTWSTAVSLSANHVLRFVQGGTYTISATITQGSNSVIEGEGAQSTILNWTGSSSGTLISQSGISNAYIRHIGLTGPLSGTTSIAVNLATVVNSTIDDVAFNGFGTQLSTTGDGGTKNESNGVYVLNSFFYKPVIAGIAADHTANLSMQNLQMGGLNGTQTNIILDSGVNGVNASFLQLFGGVRHLWLKCTGVHSNAGACDHTAGALNYNSPPWAIFIDQGVFDSNSQEAVVFDSTLGANTIDFSCTACWITSSGGVPSGGSGLHISGGQKIGFTAGGRIRGNSLNGVLIDSANVSDVLIADSFITNNNESNVNSGDAHGVYITAAASNVRIENNRIGNITEPFGGGHQQWGIKLSASAPNFVQRNNDLTGNATGKFVTGSTVGYISSDGTVPVFVTTAATCTVGVYGPGCPFDSIYSSDIYDNQEATGGAAVTYTLPVAFAGAQHCFENGYNGSVADTGALTIQTSAAGQYIIFTDGTLSASGGFVSSGGAGGDAACVRGVDGTHWRFIPTHGTWTKH